MPSHTDCGFHRRRTLEEGRYGSIRELAAREQTERTLVAPTLGLTLLATDIVEAILAGREPLSPSVEFFRRGFPDSREAQQAALTSAAKAAPVGHAPWGRG